MIRLLLLLLGAQYVRSWWRTYVAIGLALVSIGAFLLVDTLDGDLLFPLHAFGVVLLAEGTVMTFSGFAATDVRRRIVVARGLFVAVSGALVAVGGTAADLLLSLVFGTVFVLDGVLRIAAATVVRFTGWRMVIGAGVLELVLGALIIDPHVVPYVETVEFVTGFMIVLAGAALARLGWSLRLLRPGELLPQLFSRGWLPIEDLAAAMWSREGSNGTLIAHVWTAEGTAEHPAIPRPLINRYIAAVDRKGVVSTGHAAVEVPGVFYASHYPAVEIDRSSPDFQRLLRATPDNDVPGRFLASYAQETDGWVESTAKVLFGDFNVTRVSAWWTAYSRDATYNLTNRSCSTTAAYALETALEGVIGARQPRLVDVVRLCFCPELWLAGQLRTRAETMAWTPGLVLDYASALHASLRRAQSQERPMDHR